VRAEHQTPGHLTMKKVSELIADLQCGSPSSLELPTHVPSTGWPKRPENSLMLLK
jgi:hypothetical protein